MFQPNPTSSPPHCHPIRFLAPPGGHERAPGRSLHTFDLGQVLHITWLRPDDSSILPCTYVLGNHSQRPQRERVLAVPPAKKRLGAPSLPSGPAVKQRQPTAHACPGHALTFSRCLQAKRWAPAGLWQAAACPCARRLLVFHTTLPSLPGPGRILEGPLIPYYHPNQPSTE